MAEMGPAENCIAPALLKRALLVVEALRDRALTVVMAESCTAGLISALLSLAPRAGECLHGGYVVYSKEQKSATLGVDAALLSSKGSVNAKVALQMARRTAADLSLAVTGVLGPNPDEDANPPGLVHFAACRRGSEPLAWRKHFEGQSPDSVRWQAVEQGLKLLLCMARG
jgi:PncC family amidohydrolase